MDEAVLVVAILFIIMGVAGVFIPYIGISETMRPLAEFSAFLLALGIVMLPIGLLRGGLPILSSGKVYALSFMGISLISFVLVSAALQIGPFAKVEQIGLTGPTPFNVTIVILPGSYDPAATETYSPASVKVLARYNSTVIWVNAEKVSVAHTVTSDQGLFDSGLFGAGERWVFVFGRAGIYPYHCTPHPWMVGTVTVVEGPLPETPPQQPAS
ncbi:MAG: plastocyanin/azurin family copper-binding protein [Candidatus Caldarchaeum sp.]|nr:plastocyanin/azurin family copper-binding protein [Candidatus Caldarchaeum sp.]MCS7133203.1 plastocyanin/azurin family copper-binding protein [Candidatus Caldarchaeum sp.]MCX8201107.1 plastocyanin/azurin family copper-binding protein [Candidatus Caldarchaeum sp.]MDW8063063.1 plastocyanin/azurin family copper-binding protein [Candidatus Caldarchaeum sp.]MDW8434702.1 plastocyanin/azurin family copper-binding protein [Candidatus Caldarchaeum sp.]